MRDLAIPFDDSIPNSIHHHENEPDEKEDNGSNKQRVKGRAAEERMVLEEQAYFHCGEGSDMRQYAGEAFDIKLLGMEMRFSQW
mmetsp:Transcript_129807/g.225608  ORF Transcript_129807/g.225608 Transcript_129807/m.225608 type:complete len:84 (+) Transcript_129807:720-971(+)